MLTKRQPGEIQPGIKWGPFKARIPFVHLRLSIPDMLQGIAVAGATGLALVPVFMGFLGLNFEEAVTMAMYHSMLISASWLLFGDPYAPGWLTPAIPLILGFLSTGYFMTEGGTPDFTLRIQAMTAMTLNFSAILIVLGLTGFGDKLVKWVPDVFKGGIILGAAVAAFIRVTKPGDSANVFESAPIAGIIGVSICVIFAFSKIVQMQAEKKAWLAKIVGLGLLPGFVIAGFIGFFTGEFEFNIRWEILDVATNSAALWNKTSPFVIGWPSAETFLKALPLAFITYILFFGDMVTGDELIAHTQPARPDEKLEINNSRAHLATGCRNIAMSIAAPFFSTQGVLWTGIQVILLKRWATGRDKVDSLYDSISSYYVFGLPVLFLVLPIVTLLEPLLPLALAVTLILTGFACATLALSMVKDATERGAMMITAMAFGIFDEPWIGVVVGIVSIITLCGPSVFIPGHAIDDFGPIDEHGEAEPATQKAD
ncbi:hypothetical protein [Aurantivibrio plasticivorans]